jgi:hypothetical protein
MRLLDAVVPELRELRKLQQPHELSKLQVLQRSKEHLHAIGQHIDQLGVASGTRRGLWHFVSHAATHVLSGSKWKRIYRKIKASHQGGERGRGGGRGAAGCGVGSCWA